MRKIVRYSHLIWALILCVSLGLIISSVASVQEKPAESPHKTPEISISPEKLPEVLAEGVVNLKNETTSLKNKLSAAQEPFQAAHQKLEEMRARIVALKTSMATQKLTLGQAEKELEALTAREHDITAQIKKLTQEKEALASETQVKERIFESINQEVSQLRKSKHPILQTPQMQKTFAQYQKIAEDFKSQATAYRTLLENHLKSLEDERQLLAATKTQITEDYLEKTFKEELLQRQTWQYRWQQFSLTIKSLAALPGKVHNWLVQFVQSGVILILIEKNLAPLFGLVLLLGLVWLCSRRVELLVMPSLETWQSQAEEVGPRVLLCFMQILITHIFAVGFVFWLLAVFWTMGVLGETAVWLIFHAVATLVALFLIVKLIGCLFAGKDAGGILPLERETARYYRRQFKALAAYFFLVGVFAIPNSRHLGFTTQTAEYFRHMSQIILLGWVLWLLTSRHAARLLDELPVPKFMESKAFLQVLRGAAILAFSFATVTAFLGYWHLSKYITNGASFTLIVLVQAWVLGEVAHIILKHLFQPRKGILARKYPDWEGSFKKLYIFLLRLVVVLLVLAALLLTLRFWGVKPERLSHLFAWLSWGPAVGPVKLTPLNLGLAVLILYLGVGVSRLFRTFMEIRFFPHTAWDPGVQYAISTSLHYVVLFLAILIALGALGISLTSVAIVAGGLGVGIGLGLQNIVSNFISGLILLFERPIKVGDMLVVDGQWGVVKEIKVRSTIFQTFDRYTLIIPNSDLISGKILNWTHSGYGINRLTLKVGVSYGSDVRRVTQILGEVCRANPRVVAEPPPQIFFEAYGDSSLNFNIWVHLYTPGDRIPATHELNTAIFEAFQEHGIEIPFPQRDLHVKEWPPGSALVENGAPQE